MELKKITFALTILMGLMSASSAPAEGIQAMAKSNGPTRKLYGSESKHQSIFLVQNNSQATVNKTRQSREKENQASEAGATNTENSKNKSSNSAPKSLKPFKPSEEIAAEQAVDFPVDI